jgi:hypothetical protein
VGQDAHSSEGDLAESASRTFFDLGLDTASRDLPAGLIRRDLCGGGSMEVYAFHRSNFTTST